MTDPANKIEYEKTDADLSAVTKVGVGIAVLATVVALALVPILKGMVARQAQERRRAAAHPRVRAGPPGSAAAPAGRAVRRLDRAEGAPGIAARKLRLGGRAGRRRAHPDRPRDEAADAPRPAGSRRSGRRDAGGIGEPRRCTCFARAAPRRSAPVSARGLVLGAALLATAPALAQERPSALRDVGFDQRLDQVVPGDIALRDESGRPVRLARLLRTQAGRALARLLRVPDALHADAQRPGQRHERDLRSTRDASTRW